MTTILSPARDVRVRTATLATTATLAALGPLAVASARALLPYDTVDDHATIVAQVAAHPAADGAVLWLAYLIVLTLPLSVLVAGRAAMRARPVLGGVAAVVAWVGFASLAYVVGSDQVIQAAIDTGLAPAQAAAVSAAVEVPPVAGVATGVFVIGHSAARAGAVGGDPAVGRRRPDRVPAAAPGRRGGRAEPRARRARLGAHRRRVRGRRVRPVAHGVTRNPVSRSSPLTAADGPCPP